MFRSFVACLNKISDIYFGGKNVEIKLILNTVNEGFPKGNNTGVAVATGEFLLFLNSDVILKEVIWSDLFSFFDKNLILFLFCCELTFERNN